MVDFNSGEALQTPVGDIYKLLIIQRRYDFFEVLEKYTAQEIRNTLVQDFVLKSRLWTFYLEIQPLFSEDESASEVERKIKDASTTEEYREVAKLLNDFVIKKRILTTIPRVTGRIEHFKTKDPNKAGVEIWEEEPTT